MNEPTITCPTCETTIPLTPADRLTAVDLRALSPLKWQHVNPYGTFTLNMKERLPLKQAGWSARSVRI